MGNKIITEKDFWMCTGGNFPAQLQSMQRTTQTKEGEKYITIIDTATTSYIDFGCKKLMLIMAIVAAVVAVAVVATGGAALIAIGALAGAAGAAFGAVMGGLICGQVAKMARVWLGSKNNMIVQGKSAITSGHKMKCMLFGDEITHAPNITDWWQAITVGSVNTGAKVVEGALYGMMVGMGAGVLKGFIQLGAPTLTSAGVNIVGSFGTLGSSIRAVFGMQNVADNWAMGKIENLTLQESKDAFIEGAIPEYEISKRIATTGEIRPSDAMLLLYLLKFKNPTKPLKEELLNEKSTQKTTNSARPENGKSKEKFEAFEGEPLIQSDVLPEGTKLNVAGRLFNIKTGQFVKGYNKISKTSNRPYNRNMSERKKALLRDAKDYDSGLSDDARKYIKDTNGNKVPDKKYNKDYTGIDDYAVHHEEPLYTEKSLEGKKALDKSDKMKTIPKQDHIDTHSYCGNTYHKFGPHQNHK